MHKLTGHGLTLAGRSDGDLMSFSGSGMQLNNILYFLRQRPSHTDFRWSGGIAGARAPGTFSTLSHEISHMPTGASDYVAPLNRAMRRGYSKITREGERF
jgi:hypothetical protein